MRLLSFLLLASYNPVFAQIPSKEFDFANYLINKELYEDASFILNKILVNNKDLNVQDTSNFLLGKIYFKQKMLSDAIFHFDQVRDQSVALSAPSVFFSALSSSYSEDYTTASSKLLNYRSTDANLYNLRTLELAAINLLNRNIDQYDSLTRQLDKSNYLVGPTSEDLDFHKKKLLSLNRKSGLKAGLLSALIPGAGRIYVEKPGQGIYQLIIASLMGLQTWESYKKDGVQSARFIVYGALFTSFYIGNIWGSTIGVKIYKNEVRKTVDEAILMDMHIPLRAIFR